MIPISICVIMKNEEKHLEMFLSSIQHFFKDFPHEIVLVDTGSNDNTLSIARKYTDKIYHFKWIDDFSAARNFSLSCASCDWILVLDCDEYVTHLDPKGLQTMIEKYPGAVGTLSRRNHIEANGTDNVYTDEADRLFNRKTFHYEGIIHEQLCTTNGYNFMRVPLPLLLEHCAYNGNSEESRKKLKQNTDLLFKALKENPDEPYLYFHLGQSLYLLQDYEKACHYYSKGLEYTLDPKADYVQMMVLGYGYALLRSERYAEALQFENIYDKFATTSDFVCLMGVIYLRNGMTAQAMKEFARAASFVSARIEGSNSFIPAYYMGSINERQGNIEQSVALYKKCGNYKPALDRLRNLLP